MNRPTVPDTPPRHLAGGKPADSEDHVLRRRFEAVQPHLGVGAEVLLDFGCGNGAQTLWFQPLFRHTVGVDVDRAYLRRFRSRLQSSGRTGAYVLAQYDGRRLPLSDESVDTVISFEVLEHVTDEAQAIAEIHRVLRPGGMLALSVPNRWWIFETHGAELPWLPWNRVPFFSWLPRSLHDRWARARIYRRREIAGKLAARGFSVQRAGYLTAPMDVLPEGWMRRVLRATVFRPHLTPIPFLATAVLVIARKD